MERVHGTLPNHGYVGDCFKHIDSDFVGLLHPEFAGHLFRFNPHLCDVAVSSELISQLPFLSILGKPVHKNPFFFCLSLGNLDRHGFVYFF